MQSDQADGEFITLRQLIVESYNYLNSILTQSENATLSVLDYVEHHIELHEEREELLKKDSLTAEELQMLRDKEVGIGNDLSEVISLLSFQDLNGQRIKKLLTNLKHFENAITDIDKKIMLPGKQLKGPESNNGQVNIDSLLAQFDL